MWVDEGRVVVAEIEERFLDYASLRLKRGFCFYDVVGGEGATVKAAQGRRTPY
jgi:hypothetical protein